MRQHVDKVCDGDFALLLVIGTLLWLACVGIVSQGHQWGVDCILKGVRVQTTMASPRSVIAIEELLSRESLHLACLEENVSLDGIDCSVCP